jgi:hypothetical protein
LVVLAANPSEDADSQPVVLYEGSFQGTPGTIALACRTGKVTVEALLADRQMGAMHYKSHKADLLIPVRECDNLRPIELEEGAPIKGTPVLVGLFCFYIRFFLFMLGLF